MCRWPATEAARRANVDVELQLDGYGTVHLPVFIKVYGAKDDSLAIGKLLLLHSLLLCSYCLAARALG